MITVSTQGVKPNDYDYIPPVCTFAMWSDIGYLLHSVQGKRVLKVLQRKRTPGQIAKETGMSVQSVSKIVQKLRSRKLIKCLNPRDFSYRLYTITPKGKKALKMLEAL